MNYEQLKKVIQEAVPDIMELKTFCDNHSCNHKESLEEAHCWCCGLNIVRQESVLHPIRLADVLHTHNEFVAKTKTNKEIYKDVCDIYEKWHLTNNSLDNQSDETKKFLIDLLVKD